MLVLFDEKDLVDFGNYLLSKERKEDYAKQLEADKISEFLGQVNTYDLQKWIQDKNLKNSQTTQETNESTNSK